MYVHIYIQINKEVKQRNEPSKYIYIYICIYIHMCIYKRERVRKRKIESAREKSRDRV